MRVVVDPLGALASLREAISFQVSSKLINFILASLYIGITKSRQVFYEIEKKCALFLDIPAVIN